MSTWICIKNYLKQHRKLAFIAILIIVATTVLSLIPPQLLRYIVDEIIGQRNRSKIFTFACIYTGIYLLLGLVSVAKEILLVCISQGITKQIRVQMLEHVHRLTFINFTKYDSASLEAYFNNDVSTIQNLISSGVISMSIDLFKMIGIVVSVFIFSRIFGIMILCILPLVVWITMFIRKRMFHAQISMRNLEGNVNHLIYENVENMQAIKLYDSNYYSGHKLKRVLKQHYEASSKANLNNAVYPVIMECIKDILICVLIILSGLRGNFLGMSVGAVVSLISLITDLFEPIENLGMELQTIQTSMAGITRVNKFFLLEEEEEKLEVTIEDKKHLVLEFLDVSFSYDGKEEVISHFSLRMELCDKVTLQGRSGAGKSTLFKLAYGLLKPSSGRVTINGIDTYLLPDAERASLFGIVYQDPFFSGESIYHELTMHQSIDEEKVFKALHMVGLNRITDLSQMFMESNFSSGELSLLNIARLILSDCKVLFLDEMNAKIDPATANLIMSVMNRIAKDKLVLSINHYGNLLENSKIIGIDH